MSLVSARKLSKVYKTVAKTVTALDSVSLDIDHGDRVALVGRSGSGKTTLLNLLAGLDRPTSGKLEVAGNQLSDLDEQQLAAYRSTDIGVIFQSFQLIPNRTALQNVELPLIFQAVSKQDRREQAETVLEKVGLISRGHHRPSELSGGEQQRVAIARAIVHRPKLLLADEPTGNLDSKTAEQITRLMLDIVAQTEAALVLITHDQQLAQRCGQRILTLSDGKLIGEDQ